MIFSNASKIILCAALYLTFSAACKVYDSDANLRGDNPVSQNSENAANNQANQAKDDVFELSKIINLPYEPTEEAVYREEKINENDNQNAAPNGKKLIAVLKFSDADTAKIIEQNAKYQPVPAKLDIESWFPPELIANSQQSGDESLRGATYPAGDFYRPPYSQGKLTRINNSDFFVLELFAPNS